MQWNQASTWSEFFFFFFFLVLSLSRRQWCKLQRRPDWSGQGRVKSNLFCCWRRAPKPIGKEVVGVHDRAGTNTEPMRMTGKSWSGADQKRGWQRSWAEDEANWELSNAEELSRARARLGFEIDGSSGRDEIRAGLRRRELIGRRSGGEAKTAIGCYFSKRRDNLGIVVEIVMMVNWLTVDCSCCWS
jgi:hypothetical protein